jgi:hypothetical protein
MRSAYLTLPHVSNHWPPAVGFAGPWRFRGTANGRLTAAEALGRRELVMTKPYRSA